MEGEPTTVCEENSSTNNVVSDDIPKRVFAIEVRIGNEKNGNFEGESDECHCKRKISDNASEGQSSNLQDTGGCDETRIQISVEGQLKKSFDNSEFLEDERALNLNSENASTISLERSQTSEVSSDNVEDRTVGIHVPVIRSSPIERNGDYLSSSYSSNLSDSSTENNNHFLGVVRRVSEGSSDEQYSEVDLGDSGPSSLNSRDEESTMERNQQNICHQNNPRPTTRIPFFHLFSSSAPIPLNVSNQNRNQLNPFGIMVSPLPVLPSSPVAGFSLHDIKPSISSSFFSSVMTVAFVGILWLVIFMVFGSRGHAIAGVFIGLFFIGLLINTCFLKLYFRLRLFFGLNAALAAAEQESVEAERRRQMQEFILTQKATEKPPSYATVIESPPPYDLLQYYTENKKPIAPSTSCSTSDNTNLKWHQCPFCGKEVPVFGLCPSCQIKLSQ